MIPSSTTEVCKRLVVMATAVCWPPVGRSCVTVSPSSAATYNVHRMERGIPGQTRTIKGHDADVVARQEVLPTDGQHLLQRS